MFDSDFKFSTPQLLNSLTPQLSKKMCYSIAYLERKAKKLAERYKDFLPADWSEHQDVTMKPAASGPPSKRPTQTGILFPEERPVPPPAHAGSRSAESEALPSDPSDLPIYYFVNGFSHPQLPVIVNDGIRLYQWGLVPFWSKDTAFADGIRSKTLNAKGETVFEKPSFRSSITVKRCLLPVSGFFEWREVNKVKVPYFIGVKDSALFSLGCINDSWTDRQTGEVRDTFSIITTPANPMMEKIHNLKKRMPLIIGRDDEAAWVDPDLDAAGIKRLIKPYHEDEMQAYTVSRFLNSPRNDRNVPEALEEVVYDGLD